MKNSVLNFQDLLLNQNNLNTILEKKLGKLEIFKYL
jgi:hypothetical protein